MAASRAAASHCDGQLSRRQGGLRRGRTRAPCRARPVQRVASASRIHVAAGPARPGCACADATAGVQRATRSAGRSAQRSPRFRVPACACLRRATRRACGSLSHDGGESMVGRAASRCREVIRGDAAAAHHRDAGSCGHVSGQSYTVPTARGGALSSGGRDASGCPVADSRRPGSAGGADAGVVVEYQSTKRRTPSRPAWRRVARVACRSSMSPRVGHAPC